jgi:hypothetical protein
MQKLARWRSFSPRLTTAAFEVNAVDYLMKPVRADAWPPHSPPGTSLLDALQARPRHAATCHCLKGRLAGARG